MPRTLSSNTASAQPDESPVTEEKRNPSGSGRIRAQRPPTQDPTSMRLCPTCGARYEAPAQYCQRDGAPLRIEQEARDPYLGTKILGQYRVEKVIGSGGMGVVYAAWDEGLGRRAAVKILHKDLVTNRDVVARFHREAQIAHQLDHPNIVRLIHFGQLPDNNLFLLLEFLEGPTLFGAIERDGPMPAPRAAKIMAAAADAMGYAHRRDIVHRDLKPENIILVTREGDPDVPKILDFGIAKMLMGGDTLVTQAGLIFGTARYISPEGAQGDPVDKRSDVYSLGVIAFQLLTGRTPFEAQEPVQLLLKHIHEAPPSMRAVAPGREFPPALEAVVMRALAKSPAARYGDGTSFARALREAALESDPSSAIRSVVPTAAMPMYAGSPSALGSAAVAYDPQAGSISPVQHAPQAAFYSPPGVANPDSGVRQNPTVHPVPPVAQNTVVSSVPASALLGGHVSHAHGASASAASSGPHAAVNHARAYAPTASARPLIPPTAAMEVFVPPPGNGRPFNAFDPHAGEDSQFYPSKPGQSAFAGQHPTGSYPGAHSESDDSIDIPGLGSHRRKHSAAGAGDSRTIRTVIVSVLMTLVIGAGAAWALGLYPSQRVEAERERRIADLLHRAEDAFNAGHFARDPGEADVARLTTRLLRIVPGHERAIALRTAAAARLRNNAVQLRNEGHPDRALPLLRDAISLSENDAELRALITTIEQEIAAPPPPVVVVPPPVRTPPRNTRTRAAPQVQPAPPPDIPVPAVISGRPTFTPGRDPSAPPPVRPAAEAPPVRPQTIIHHQPTREPAPPMVGGPSEPETPPPSSDPNGGGVAF